MERKILIFDIETMPDLMQVFKHLPRVDDWPGQSLKASINSVLCIGYKWLGEKNTKIIRLWDHKEWSKSVNNDAPILKEFAKIFNEADAIVTQNGKKFDIKFLQTRYVINGLNPLDHKVLHLDTKQIAKRYLYSIGNRLDDLAEITSSEKKLENGGWSLWEKCWHRDSKALKLMERYCKQDVATLEQVFLKLRPFITQIPNANMWKAEGNVCPACGSLNVKKDGFRTYKEKKVQRLRCGECGGRSQETIKGPRT